MPRNAGDRYSCEKCGAQLVYEKPCPCPPSMPHVEICCGEQMKAVGRTSEAEAGTSGMRATRIATEPGVDREERPSM